MTSYIERYWRDATPQDAIKEPPMVARFRYSESYDWRIDSLTGIRCNHDYPWYSIKLGWHKQCQVYDAPDPGEGWRLVDIEKDDYSQDGIECWYEVGKQWCSRRNAGTDKQPFKSDMIYRIRIEQSKPKYVPFRWEDREQLRGRWIVRSKDGETREEVAYRFDSRAFDVLAKHLLEDDWTFLDTGEPVGRRVE